MHTVSSGTDIHHSVFLVSDVTFFLEITRKAACPERMSYYIPGVPVFISYGYPSFVICVTELEQVSP